MSGHSHWAGIKHKKELADKKRGKIFSKLSRIISIAAKDGADANSNSKLRMAIEKAKEFNMPNENIERAIKKGSNQIDGTNLEEFLCEGIGPGNIAIIIEGITDNKNRTMNDIKQILNHHGGKITPEKSIRWLFERYGIIKINLNNLNEKSEEDLELKAIEAGAVNLKKEKGFLKIYTKPEELEMVKTALIKNGYPSQESFLEWVPKEEVSANQDCLKNLKALFEALDENDDVQQIYSNLKENSI